VPDVVSQRLGHASPTIPLTVYAHVMPGNQREAADLFGPAGQGGERAVTSANPVSEPPVTENYRRLTRTDPVYRELHQP